MSKLDKDLNEIIYDYAYSVDSEYGDEYVEVAQPKVIVQIKSTILEALLAEMPKKYLTQDDKEQYQNGYNQALTDCLEVIKKTLQ